MLVLVELRASGCGRCCCMKQGWSPWWKMWPWACRSACWNSECLTVWAFHKHLQPLWEEMIREQNCRAEVSTQGPDKETLWMRGQTGVWTFPNQILPLCRFAWRCLWLTVNFSSWFFGDFFLVFFFSLYSSSQIMAVKAIFLSYVCRCKW